MKSKSEMKSKKLYKAFQAVSIVALFFFAIMVSTHLAQRVTPKTAKANTDQTKAFSLDSLTDFQDYLNTGTDENGFSLSAFNATFNTATEDDSSNKLKYPKLYKKNGKAIDLAERCIKNEPKTPCRYWFFVKSNKLKKPGSMYWQTVGFTGTTKKTNNTATPANMNYVNIKYVQADTNKDSFFTSDGKDLSSGGESYGLSLYVIDIKDWFLATVDDYDNYTEHLYLQSITQIFNPNGTAVTRKFTNCTEWKAAANKFGFAASGIATYPQHYNIKLDISGRRIHRTVIHRIESTEDYPIKGENSNGEFDAYNIKGKEVRGINAESSFTISGANTYKLNDKTYYLKGIRITDENKETGEVKEAAHFYILDNPFSSKTVKITGTAGIKSNNYSKKSGTGTGKNTIGKDRYCRDRYNLHGILLVIRRFSRLHGRKRSCKEI